MRKVDPRILINTNHLDICTKKLPGKDGGIDDGMVFRCADHDTVSTVLSSCEKRSNHRKIIRFGSTAREQDIFKIA
jgi:hypothetical protein